MSRYCCIKSHVICSPAVREAFILHACLVQQACREACAQLLPEVDATPPLLEQTACIFFSPVAADDLWV